MAVINNNAREYQPQILGKCKLIVNLYCFMPSKYTSSVEQASVKDLHYFNLLEKKKKN